MKRLLCTFLSLFFLWACAVPAVAAQSHSGQTVRVGFPLQRGLTEIDEAGNYTGYTYEYLEHVAQFTSWQYEYVTVDGDLNTQILTLMDMLSKGEIDLLGCTIKSDAMEDLYEYPDYSYGAAYTVLCSLDTNTALTEATFPRYAKKGLRVAAYESSQSRIALLKKFCDANGYTCTVATYPSSVSLTDVLDAGEADVSLGVDLSRDERTKIVASFAGVPYYFIGTKGNTPLMVEYDRAVEKLEETEPYLQDSLYSTFFSNNRNLFVLTESEKEYISTLDPIKVILYNQHAPFQSRSADGAYTGISVSLLNAISQDTGLRFDFLTEEQWRNLSASFSGNALYMGVPESRETMHNNSTVITHPYASTEMALFSRENLSLQDLSKKVLALTEGDRPLDGYGYSSLKYYPCLQDCIAAVANGEVDYGLANSYSVSYYLSRNYLNLHSLVLPGVERSYSFAFVTPADTKLIAIFNRYIDTQAQNTTYGYLVSEMSAAPEAMTFLEYIRLYPGRSLLITLSILLVVFGVAFCLLRIRQKQRLLEAESRAKTEFLSRMSHDMRTPMNAIIGLSGLALDQAQNPEVVDYLGKISESGRYLLGLINDTLDMSRIESGKIELFPEPYQLSEFCKILTDLLEPKAAEKGVKLVICADCENSPPLLLDRMRFTQIFVNLGNNAVKFTPSGGTVEITIEQLEQQGNLQDICIAVRDTGIGMSAEFQEKMYESFEQEQPTGITAEAGTGLGLAIVRQLVELMHARILCDSAPGRGTTFSVFFTAPIADVPDAANPGAVKAPDLSVLSGRRILLAEDHPLNTKVAVKLLEKEGMTVDCAANGQAAVEQFAASPPDWYAAILMDIRMPVLDGLSAARQIRALDRPDAKTVPILAMTANAYSEDMQKSAEAGMNAHLSKPIDPTKLYATLAVCLEKSKPDSADA